jgi:hypothetical protein
MLNYETVANENPEPSLVVRELGNNDGGRETQAALDSLHLRLDAIAAKVFRLEVALQKQRALLRRDSRDGAIIGALLMLSGLLAFALVARLL